MRLAIIRLLLFSLICLCVLFCRDAEALVGDTEGAFGLDGSVRTLFFLLDQDGTLPLSGQNHIDGLSQTILRLTAEGRPTNRLSYQIHWVQSLTVSTEKIWGASDVTFGYTNNVSRYRVLDSSWDVLDDERAQSTIFLDRFNVKMSFDWADVICGRQAITFGKTYFWNPLDVFYPFDASQFDRDYKPGVDAVRVDIPLGSFSGVNLVGAAGPTVGIGTGGENGNDPQDASWYGSAVLARGFTDVSGWDLSFQAGKIFGGWQVGAGAVGDVGPVQVRGEAVEFVAMSSDPLPPPLQGELVEDSFLAVFGLARRFENGLTLDFEYFYNGAGDPNHLNVALVRTQFGSSLQMSRHLAGLMASYEITPLMVGQVGTITSLSDGSIQLLPLLTISLSDEMDLLVGSILNFGPAPKETSGPVPDIQSEFGTFPNMFYAEWKYYF
jgi:hypothetical protein